MAKKISCIYKITNTVTGDFYIGSSKNVKRRWKEHKCKSKWNRYPNNPMYQDMRKYGVDKFVFEVLEVVEPEELKETEQKFIETLKPTYNNINAKGLNIERYKEAQKKYEKTEKRKDYQKQYKKSEKYKKAQKEYNKSEKRKKAHKEYDNQLCFYNGETITLCALRNRFRKMGISNPTAEAKKYLLK